MENIQTAETYLSQAIDAAEPESKYDTNVKWLLSDKQILAWILKFSVKEFSGIPIDDMINSIENDVEVGTRPVDAGLSNAQRITGDNTEDNIPGEGKIIYDIRFSVKMGMKFLINIEAQRTSDPHKLGYPLENRMMFYVARMVSAQKNTEFFHSDYGSLKPVVSIFICMDEDLEECEITEIGLNADTILGEARHSYNTNLMRGIIIRLRGNENLEKTGNDMIDMLEILLSQKDADKKKEELEEYGLNMTEELEGRISDMCNLSLNIREKGIQEGMKKGMEKGMKEERHNAIKRMLQNGFKKEQILSLGYTVSEYEAAEKELLVNA